MVLENSLENTNVPIGGELKNAGDDESPSKLAKGCCLVDPNIVFFCQIVALAVPISVLYGGLYFVSSSASVIAVVCGSIVVTILCIIVLTKPFSGSQDVEESETASRCEGLISSAMQNSGRDAIYSQKSILKNPLQKLLARSKLKTSRKNRRLRSCCRESSKGRTTSSECSFLSDAEEGKCLLGPPRISSESEDGGMDLLNINEKVLRRDDYFGPPSLRNAETKRRIAIEKPNYRLSNMVNDCGLKTGSPRDSGLGQIDEEDIPNTVEDPCSMEPYGIVENNQSTIIARSNEKECLDGADLEEIEDCIVIRLFPKSPKVGKFELELDKEIPPASARSRDCETCITPKATIDGECQTSNARVDASCDVMFVDERKNSASQTSWLDSMKTIHTPENVQELYGEQSRVDKVIQTVYAVGGLPKQATKECVEDEAQSDKKISPSSLRGGIPSTDKLSIVDFVLRGKFSTPSKPSQGWKQDEVFRSNALGTQTNIRSTTKDQKLSNSSRKGQNNLDLVRSGATVSSYQTSRDWWHAVNSLEKNAMAPFRFHDMPQMMCPEHSTCRCPPGSSDRVVFQPKKCGLLATESSIEDIRRKMQQIEKPKLLPANKSPRKREDSKGASPTKIKPFDLRSPPRKVQRKVELFSSSPTRKETSNSRNTTINCLGAATTEHEILKDSPKHLYKDYEQPCRANLARGFPQSRGKNVILMDDSSDVASITESAKTDCASVDVPAKFKVKTKKGVSTVKSTIFKKSSSSYDNVTIERILTQKKKTFKKFT